MQYNYFTNTPIEWTSCLFDTGWQDNCSEIYIPVIKKGLLWLTLLTSITVCLVHRSLWMWKSCIQYWSHFNMSRLGLAIRIATNRPKMIKLCYWNATIRVCAIMRIMSNIRQIYKHAYKSHSYCTLSCFTTGVAAVILHE